MARTTISLPNDLKSRMDEVADVNWSAMAARSFEQKLGQLAAQKETKTMQDVISRLRASKLAHEDEAHQDGHAAGEEWAKNCAEYSELRRLTDFSDWDDFLTPPDVSSAYTLGELLAFRVLGEEADRSDADALLVAMGLEHNDTDPDILRGFVDGALGVYSEVQAKV
ncbi:MAG: hypothetical protein ACREX9_21875 [Gammaproteobacteria bacterium]